jgi:hypothetical protein
MGVGIVLLGIRTRIFWSVVGGATLGGIAGVTVGVLAASVWIRLQDCPSPPGDSCKWSAIALPIFGSFGLCIGVLLGGAGGIVYYRRARPRREPIPPPKPV